MIARKLMPETPPPSQPTEDTTVTNLNALEFAAALEWCAKRYHIQRIRFNPDRKEGEIYITKGQGLLSAKGVEISFQRKSSDPENILVYVNRGLMSPREGAVSTPHDTVAILDGLQADFDQLLQSNLRGSSVTRTR